MTSDQNPRALAVEDRGIDEVPDGRAPARLVQRARRKAALLGSPTESDLQRPQSEVAVAVAAAKIVSEEA